MHALDAEMGGAVVVISQIFFSYLFNCKILSDLFHFVGYLVQYFPVVKFLGRPLMIICLLKS